MPIKRPHKKSRYGCDQCRKRRVKCDERLPRCSNCVHREDRCNFSRQRARTKFRQLESAEQAWSSTSDVPDTESSPSAGSFADVTPPFESPYDTGGLTPGTSEDAIPLRPTSDPTSDDGACDLASDAIRYRELELMHHWCTRTCYSFTPQFAELLRDHVAKEALRCDYLMAALLALTSLHLGTETDDTLIARHHVNTALRYQTQAVSGLREHLHDINPSNCGPVVLTSMMIMVCATVSPLLPTSWNDEVKSTAAAMLPLVDFLKGIRSLVDHSRQWLVQGPLAAIISDRKKPSATETPFPARELHQLNDAIAAVDAYAYHVYEDGVHKHEVFRNAIEKLEEAFQNGISVIPWLIRVGPEFMDALRNGEYMAVAIFMHWGVFLDRLDDMWWAKYSGRRLVRELSTELDKRGEEWRQVTQWCRVQVGL